MINVQGTAGFTLKQVSAISPNWIIEPLTSRASPSSDMMNSNNKSNDNTTKSTSHSAAEQDLFCVGPDQSTNLFFRITPITTPTPTPSTTTDTRYKRDYWWIRTTTIYDETCIPLLHSLIYLFFLPIINNNNKWWRRECKPYIAISE